MSLTEPALSPITAQVDNLQRELYRRGRGQLYQTVLTDYTIADAYRNYLDPAFAVASNRAIVRVARASWNIMSMLTGTSIATWVGGVLWMCCGLPELLFSCLRMHPASYDWQGDRAAAYILLRTGVSNEPVIARWITQRVNASVLMLQYKQAGPKRLASLRHFPGLLFTYIGLCLGTTGKINSMVRESILGRGELKALMPMWFVQFARGALHLSWSHCWAKNHLAPRGVKALYFTMNYANENAFRLALPGVPAAYVEHGFPRRGFPPLPCRQYVYSPGYAKYLASFDDRLEVEVIGLDYFDKTEIMPTRLIVIASLQDWDQFRITDVKEIFNSALEAARRHGWKLVFRTRSYDTDSFSRALAGPWDEFSLAAEETFHQCLERTRPAMVWTTWSTAVLDARAHNVAAVAFVTSELEEHFIADLDAFTFVVKGAESLGTLQDFLQYQDVGLVMRECEPVGHSTRIMPAEPAGH